MTIHVSAFPSQAIATPRTDGGSEILRFASEDRFEEVDIYLTYLSSGDLRKIAIMCLLTARRLDSEEAEERRREEDRGPAWLEDIL